MKRFVEAPLDPNFQNIVRKTLERQPEQYFLQVFGGRRPSPREKCEFIEQAVLRMTPLRVYENDIYRVEVANTPPITPTFIHLAVSMLDGGTCNEWSDLQRIKNEIVGPEYEAIELFPAESRLVNAGNEYHLWVHSDPRFRFPVGWAHRVVLEKPAQICRDAFAKPEVFDRTGLRAPVRIGATISLGLTESVG